MKDKISISLDEQMVSALDGLVDNKTVRNRSQAVEFVLSQYFESNAPLKAVLLGGKMEESAKSIHNIAAILSQLKKAGISEIIVAGGKATENIFSEIQNDAFFSKKSIFLREDKPMGTAGALKLASNYLSGTFVVSYLDVSFEMDLKKMIEQHKQTRALATMALTYVPTNGLTDYIRITGDTVTEFEYKTGRTTKLQNAAVYVFEVKLLEELPTRGSLEKDSFPQLAKDGKLKAFVFDTKWKHLED